MKEKVIDMHKWNLFWISIGCLLIMLAQTTSTPMPIIVSGILLIIVGAMNLFRKNKKVR